MRHPWDRRSRSYFWKRDRYRELRGDELGDVQDAERIGAWDARKDGDEVGNRSVRCNRYEYSYGLSGLGAASARDTRRRARAVVLTLTGKLVAGARLSGDQRGYA
jgi:hypothetical protein